MCWNLNVDMNEVETRQFQVWVRAVDTELKDLSIWIIHGPIDILFSIMIIGISPKTMIIW